MEIFKNSAVKQLDKLFGQTTLSGEKTRERMAKLIRDDFDRLVYCPVNFDSHVELIRIAKNLKLDGLASTLVSDLSFESGVAEDYINKKAEEL